MTTPPLDRSIELFASAHAAELSADDQFILGRAAGIVRRVHTSPAYLPPPPLAARLRALYQIDAELDGPAYLPPQSTGMTAAQVLELGAESLRRHHPTLAAELDAELDGPPVTSADLDQLIDGPTPTGWPWSTPGWGEDDVDDD